MGKLTLHKQLMNDAYHIKTPSCIVYCKRLCVIENLLVKFRKELKLGGSKLRSIQFQIESLCNERSTIRSRIRTEIAANPR